MEGKWIFMKCSGQVGHSIKNNWQDGFISCSTLLKLGMSDVCVVKFTIRGSFNAGKLGNCILQWRHNERDSVSNHQPRHSFLNRLFRRGSNKTSTPRVTGLCAGNSPGTGEFPHKWPVTRKMFPFDNVIISYHFSIFEAIYIAFFYVWLSYDVDCRKLGLNTLRMRLNRRHFANVILKCIFLKENVLISTEISRNVIPMCPINNIPALVQIMAWRCAGDKHYRNQWWLSNGRI